MTQDDPTIKDSGAAARREAERQSLLDRVEALGEELAAAKRKRARILGVAVLMSGVALGYLLGCL